MVWPLLQSFRISFYRWTAYSENKKFIGFQNYGRLAKDEVFRRSLEHNLGLLAVVLICALILGVALAHLMQGQDRVSKFLRSIYLFPQVISLVVVALIWEFIFDPAWGLVTSGLNGIGLGRFAKPWLSDPTSAFWCVAIAFVWYVLGFYIMLFSAGLRGIPAEVNEASELDGAVGWRRFWKVTWPMLWSIKRIAVTYVVINVMGVFTLVYLMTQGGPDRGTEVMLTYLYEKGFTDHVYGYATTLALANFAVAMLLSGGVMFLFRKNPEGARK